ncbi:MAG: acyl-CoA dehydrogenase family protein [Trueperaceae bacterium]|nr:acyl-CoA dehydrogenase family protein [Trueperaceae bacterium]
MDQTRPRETAAHTTDLDAFLAEFRQVLHRVFRQPPEPERMHLVRGLPPSELRAILARRPLSVFIPSAYGGRGEKVHEGLAVLEAAAYESLALSLTIGINGALFLQPLSKYGREEIKGEIFTRFLEHQNMGGLMMTEPDYGSDALSMETAYVPEADGYRIRGTKHWAGLTGLADYWLMTARARGEDGQLTRDVGFFVCDAHRPPQQVQVEERFENLGLYLIPYGRNRVDVWVPEAQRLQPDRTGVKMMLDMLHRSRIQFPGMGLGFLRRMADEALTHVRERYVGGRSLLGYDQVQRRVAHLQASVTAAAAMCVHAAETAHVGADLSKESVTANATKAVLTDMMHDASQSLLQLVGAKGYRLDHIAGRATVDSRPFQIFEGSNDILYEQLAEAVLKQMRRAKQTNLGAFLRGFEPASRAAEHLGDVLDVRIEPDMIQRNVVDFGRVLGRVITMEFVIEFGDRGYRNDLVSNCLETMRSEVLGLFSVFRADGRASVVEEEVPAGAWLAGVNAEPS